MEPTILRRSSFLILGLQECFTPEHQDYEGIWKRYMAYHDFIKGYAIDGARYGANFEVIEGSQIDYLAGMAVSAVEELPEELTLREVPASLYAVFECELNKISDTYDWIFNEWLKTAPYRRPGKGSIKADFEHYPPSTDSGDTLVKLFIALDE